MKAAFLDRDGVLNLKVSGTYYVTKPEDFRMAAGAAEGVAELNRLGYRVFVATNQRQVSKGLLTLEGLEELHRLLEEGVAQAGGRIERIYFCPHALDACDCRKPKPGMLLAAFHDYPDIDRQASFFIGDSETDGEAARAAGLRFYRLETNGNLRRFLSDCGIAA